MVKKHTPTPWKLIKGTKEKLSKLKKGKYTLEFQGYGYDQEKEIKDAEFIVQACNNYERLQSENEKMMEFLEKRKKKLEYMQRANYFSVNDGYELAEIQTLLNPK